MLDWVLRPVRHEALVFFASVGPNDGCVNRGGLGFAVNGNHFPKFLFLPTKYVVGRIALSLSV